MVIERDHTLGHNKTPLNYKGKNTTYHFSEYNAIHLEISSLTAANLK
jgi:hypothetical protein